MLSSLSAAELISCAFPVSDLRGLPPWMRMVMGDQMARHPGMGIVGMAGV